MVLEAKVAPSFKKIHAFERAISSGHAQRIIYAGQEAFLTNNAGSISIRSLETGKAVQSITVFQDEDKAISAFVASTSHLFTALSNNLIESRSLETGELSRSWKGHNAPVSCMDHSEEVALLATGSADHSVRVWNSAQGFCTHNLKGIHGAVVSQVRFHPVSGCLEVFSAAEDGSIARWDLSTGKGKAFKGHTSAVTSFSVSADGNFLVSGGRDQVLNIWHLKTDKLLKTIPTLESVEAVVFLSGSSLFLSGGEKGALRLWDAATGRCVKESRKLTSSAFGIMSIAILEGKVLLTTTDRQIVCVGIESLAPVFNLPGDLEEVTDVALLPGGALAVSSNDSVLRVYPTIDSMFCEGYEAHTASILSVASCEEWIVTGSRDNTAYLWRRGEDGRYVGIASLSGHTDVVSAVAIFKGKKHTTPFVATASSDMTVKLWEIREDGQVASRWTIKAHEKDINCVSFTPNGKFLVTGSQDKTAKVWRLDDGQLTGTLKGHKRGVWSVACSPSEQIIATASGDRTVRLWSASGSFECLKTLEGHTNSVLRVGFLAPGKELVSTGADGLVKLWDIPSNECVRTLDEHADRIWTMALSPDSGTLVTGDASGSILCWVNNTSEEHASVQAASEEALLREQTLSNLLLRKDYRNAILLAIELNQPFRLFGLVNEFTRGAENASASLTGLLGDLKENSLNAILGYLKEWNASIKRASLAQLILGAILKIQRQKGLALPSLKDTCKVLLPYTERHFEHIQDFQSNGYMLDFILSHMDNHMIIE